LDTADDLAAALVGNPAAGSQNHALRAPDIGRIYHDAALTRDLHAAADVAAGPVGHRAAGIKNHAGTLNDVDIGRIHNGTGGTRDIDTTVDLAMALVDHRAPGAQNHAVRAADYGAIHHGASSVNYSDSAAAALDPRERRPGAAIGHKAAMA
jgi:hypothetical protein